MSNEKNKIRIFTYFLGLFIITLGIAFSVKSNLGVSPVSSVPYAMTCIWGIEMGKATIIFYAFLVAVQGIILRKDFKMKNLLQFAVGVVFGYFTTFSNWCVGFLPTPENIIIRLCFIVISIFLVALGLFFYVPANVVQLPAEGVVEAVSRKTGIEFAKVKVMVDTSFVVVALIICLCIIKSNGSVGVGTVASALFIGVVLKFLNKKLGNKRDKIFFGK